MTKMMNLRTFSKKTEIDDSDVTFCGRVFHSREAATGKERVHWHLDSERVTNRFTVNMVFLSMTKMPSTLNPIGSPFRRAKNTFTYA